MLRKFYRRADAAEYLGMSTYTFDRQARPYLTEIPISKQGVAFDRIELDEWADHHKAVNGRPGRLYGERLWDEKRRLDSLREEVYGISTKGSKGKEFAKAVDHLILQRQNDS